MFALKLPTIEKLQESFEIQPGSVESRPITNKVTAAQRLRCPVHGKPVSRERVLIQNSSEATSSIEVIGFCCNTFKGELLAALV